MSIFTVKCLACVFINKLRSLSKIYHRFSFGNFPTSGTFFFLNNRLECLLALKNLSNSQVLEFFKYIPNVSLASKQKVMLAQIFYGSIYSNRCRAYV